VWLKFNIEAYVFGVAYLCGIERCGSIKGRDLKDGTWNTNLEVFTEERSPEKYLNACECGNAAASASVDPDTEAKIKKRELK
jgi:hypothetical protein